MAIEAYLHSFLIPALETDVWLASRSGRFKLYKKIPHCALNKMMVGQQRRYENIGEEKNILLVRINELLSSSI